MFRVTVGNVTNVGILVQSVN